MDFLTTTLVGTSHHGSMAANVFQSLTRRAIPNWEERYADRARLVASTELCDAILNFIEDVTTELPVEKIRVPDQHGKNFSDLCSWILKAVPGKDLPFGTNKVALLNILLKDKNGLDLAHQGLSGTHLLVLIEALKTNPQIIALSLSNNELNDEDVNVFIDAVTQIHTLVTLDLSGNALSEEGVSVVVEYLKVNFSLTKVQITHFAVGGWDAPWLTEPLGQNFALNELRFFQNTRDVEGNHSLAESLHHKSSLKKLDLSREPEGHCAAKPANNNVLQQLSLTDIGHTGNTDAISHKSDMRGKPANDSLEISLDKQTLHIKQLLPPPTVSRPPAPVQDKYVIQGWDEKHSARLKENVSLQAAAEILLAMSTGIYPGSGSPSFATLVVWALKAEVGVDLPAGTDKDQLLEFILKDVTKLRLMNHKLNDQDMELLTKILLKTNSIKTLMVSGGVFGAKAASFLATFLTKNSTLKALHLCICKLGDEGVQYLSHALINNTSLTELVLVQNQVGVVGVSLLANCLKQNKTLTTLTVGHNPAVYLALNVLLEGVQQNVSLASLNLSGNRIDDQGVRKLTEILAKNSSLTSLDLSFNKIGDKGGRTILKWLKDQKKIVKLSLVENKEFENQKCKAAIEKCLKENSTQ